MLRRVVPVDDYGSLWINSKPCGHIPPGGREFVLTGDVRPGDRFVVAIPAVNTGDPLRLIRARIEDGVPGSLERGIDDFVPGLRTAQEFRPRLCARLECTDCGGGGEGYVTGSVRLAYW